MSRIFLGILSAAALVATGANALPSSGRSEPPGITQPDEDSDDDGLTNQEETEILGANPNNPDTDGDGLQDGAEAFPTSAMLKYPRQPKLAAYAAIDLGPAVDHQARVVDLNNNNQVLDSSGRIWTQGAWGEPLYSGATRINDVGQILSYRSSGPMLKTYPNSDPEQPTTQDTEEHWWIYLDDVPLHSGYDNHDEDEIKDNGESLSASFNNSGHVVGMTTIGIDYGYGEWRAFRWQGGEMAILPDFGIPSSETTVENQPLAINDNGAIAGIAHTDSPTTAYEGYLDQGGQRTLFGPYTPSGLNNSNHVLLSHFDDPSSTARLHLPGMGTQDLKVILGKGARGAYSGAHRPLNNRGQMLLGLGGGWTLANNSRLFRADQLLPSGWSVFPVALNDSGLIAGTGISPSAEWRNVLLLPVDMAVDSNRDGVVKFAGNFNSAAVAGKPADSTTEAKPFRFWVNDDDDRDNKDHPDSEYQNRSNNIIDSARDLEDFARLHIHVGALQDLVVDGDIQVGLEWKGVTGTNLPCVKVYQAAENNGGDQYLKNTTTALSQVNGAFATALGTITNGGSFKFPASFWEADSLAGRPVLSPQNPNRHLIFEGTSEGKGQLAITLWRGTNKIGEGPGVWLDLLDVRKMYTSSVSNMLTGTPTGETQQTLAFVHGWNMSPEGSRNYAETMFKRLWHRGYKGRFAYYRWNTDWSDAFDNAPVVGEAAEAYFANYNGSEYTAWTAGASGLKAFFEDLPYQTKNIAAHSMGNIVVSEAMRQGMKVNNYALMQPAVPAACYDDRGVIEQTQTATHAVELGLWEVVPIYTNTVMVWNRPTPDDDADEATRNLAYRGMLTTIATKGTPILFYLPNDNATSYAWEVNNAVTKPPGRMSGIFRYARNNPSGEKLYEDYGDGLHIPFFANERHKAMSFACRTWGKAAGAEAQTQGAISAANRVNLGSSTFQLPGEQFSGFGDEHSGQFKANIQSLKPFYDALMRRLGLGDPNP